MGKTSIIINIELLKVLESAKITQTKAEIKLNRNIKKIKYFVN